jgi:hypothetical protein
MQRYYITAEATYEALRQSLNVQLGYPTGTAKSIFQTALQAPRDGFRRVLLAVDTDLPQYTAILAAITPLIEADAMEEIDEATYVAAVNSAASGGGASTWSELTGTPTTLAGYGITDAAGVSHTHSASQVTDFASAVAAAAPPEVLDFLTTAQFPATGSASKIYVATDPSRAYQWTGSQYAEIGPAGAFLPVHSHAASDITSGVLATARLGSGATATNFLRGDSTYADPVTYATTAQAQAATSTTTAMSPSRTQDSLLAHAQVFPNWLNSASGGASSGAGGGFGIGLVMSLQSSTTPNGTAVLYTSGGLNNLQGLWSQGNVAGQGWTRRRILRVRVARHNTASPSANMVMRVVWGRNAITFGALNAAGVSFEVRQSRIWLVTHNGTSATETDSGADFLNNECHDFILDSNGTGGCTLFRNGVQIATNTGAPTADSTGWCSLHYQVGNGGDSTNCIYSFGPSTLSYS